MVTKLTIGRSYRLGASVCIGKLIKQVGYFSYFEVQGEHSYFTENGLVGFKTLYAEKIFVLIEEPFTKEQFIKDTCDFLDAIDTICDDYEQRQTQKKKILEYLKTGKSITKLEALKMFNIWNSGDAIFNLREEGYNIETTMITNGKRRFASYKLIEK